MNDYGYNDTDSGIDWSAVTLPGEEDANANPNNERLPASNSIGVTARHYSNSNAAEQLNHGNSYQNNNAYMSPNNNPYSQNQPQHQQLTNSFQAPPLNPPSIQQQPINVDDTDEEDTIPTNPNSSVTNSTIANQQLLEQIQKLQSLVADKDSRLFDLESTMATVEAEASFQIKQNQQQLEQQLRASQDQIRQLQKDIDSKNNAIVKLKKRNRQSMNGMNHGNHNTMSTSAPNINYPTNDVGNAAGDRFERDVAMNMNAPQSPIGRVVNDDTGGSYPHQPQNGVANTAAYPRNPTSITISGSGLESSNPVSLLQINTPPLAKDHTHNASATENRVHINDVQHETIATTVNAVHESDIEMTEASDRDQFGAMILSWKAERSNKISKTVLHLIRYNERFLPMHLIIHESGLDPDSLESCMRDDHHHRSNMGTEEDTGGLRQDRKVEWRGGARQNVRDARIHSDTKRTMKDHYDCTAQIQSMLLYILECHSGQRQRKVSTNSTSDEHNPGIEFIAKELVSVIASLEKIPLASMVQNGANTSHSLETCLSVLMELCSISPRARNCIRTYFCGTVDGDTAAKGSDRVKAANRVSRIRGLPAKYETHVKRLDSANVIGSSTVESRECNLVRDHFLETILNWIVGPGLKQFEAMSKRERIQIRLLQGQSMEFLNLLILDAPKNQYLRLQEAFIRGVKEGAGETSANEIDMISVLERSTVLAMTRRGHRHALIQLQWKESIILSVAGTGEYPDELLVKVKSKIVSLFASLCNCPRSVDALEHASKLPRYKSGVSNLKRLFAAVLDDLQFAVLPAISRQCPDESATMAVIHYGSSAILLMTSFSKSSTGFAMVRTQIKEGDLETDESRMSRSSAISIVADILEKSVLATQMKLSPNVIGNLGTFEHLRLQSLLRLVARCISFFHSIQCQCRDHTSQSGGSKRVKASFSGILTDAERSRSFFASCQKVAGMLPEEVAMHGYQNVFEPEVKLQARSMVQLLEVE